MAKDYYKILGVERNASAEDIKKAHRRLARTYHPDFNKGDKAAEEKFKEVQQAFDVLGEEEKRKKYDQYGENWQQVGQGFPGGQPGGTGGVRNSGNTGPFVDINVEDMGGAGGFSGFSFEEFLNNVTGGGGRRGQRPGGRSVFDERSAAPAEDVEFAVEVTLEEAYRGASKRINVTVEDVCPECDGMGQKRNTRGQFDLSGAVCPRCRGRGRIEASRSGEVSIPAGAWDGLRLKLTGQGAADGKGKRGDLIVQLRVLPNPKFERDGQNLTFDVTVPYTIAGLGGEVSVETISGQKRQLVVPPGIQAGQKLRLSGQGMPALRDRSIGDAFARVKITVPRDLSDQEKSLLEQIAHLRR